MAQTFRRSMGLIHRYGEQALQQPFVRSIDLDGNFLDESYNISHWRLLESSGAGRSVAPHPPAHLHHVLPGSRGPGQLRLYREVSGFDGRNQTYEYLSSHALTGVMRDAKADAHA